MKKDLLTCIGISAAKTSFPALKSLFSPTRLTKNTFCIITHDLSQEYINLFISYITQYTKWNIHEINKNASIQKNHIYVIPKSHNISIKKNKIYLESIKQNSLTIFFDTIAQGFKESSTGIILSEKQSIPVSALKNIKRCGGITIIQEKTNKQNIPQHHKISSIDFIDWELNPSNMLRYAYTHAKTEYNIQYINDYHDKNTIKTLHKIFHLLKKQTKINFDGYKLNTICRRMNNRIGITQTKSLTGYLHLLQNNTEEVEKLKQSLLINVTHFFRDKEAFQQIENQIIPPLMDNRKNKQLRIWINACSSGEEAFSLAILLSEYNEKYNMNANITIVATDIAKNALQKAKESIYPIEIQNDIPPNLLKKYFTKKTNHYTPCEKIKDMIVFQEHNAIYGKTIQQFDMICCRNFLIYLTPEKQKIVLKNIYNALTEEGILFLGSAESLGSMQNLFNVIDRKQKLFRKKSITATEKYNMYHKPQYLSRIRSHIKNIVSSCKNYLSF